jgi:hypothetical protein
MEFFGSLSCSNVRN